MTYQAILVASMILLLAFAIEHIGARLGFPSAALLIATGLIAKPSLAALDLSIVGLDAVVPVIGTVGLVLIVLEGALDIELRRERLQSASGALLMAVVGFAACAAIFAVLIAMAMPLSPIQALAAAIPFAVISSAVAIPSSSFLPPHGREFVVYESSVSDILGVMVFFSLVESDGTLAGALSSLAGGSLLSLFLAAACALGLTVTMFRIDGHIRFIPLLAGMFGLYAIGKLFHLSPLIMVLLFGLALNNPELITRFRPFRNWLDSSYAATLSEFKLLTAEMTFAVRGFFFILLGYWTDLSSLASFHAWIAALLALLVIYGSRRILLSVAPIEFELIDALTWLAPRGLITVLLFLAAKDALPLPAFMEGTVMLVVLISAVTTTLAPRCWDVAQAKPHAIDPAL
jgi:NhaP-type Na+/H+ or K+/H+ antiporter